MSKENKVRIICDLFEKGIEYQWYDYNLNDYVEFDPENSKLASDELVHTTIQDRAYEIIKVINSECNVGNVGLEIVFVGTDSDYEDFCRVVDTYYGECNIKCIRDSHYYKSAAEVMPGIEDRFEKIKSTLDEYTEDTIAGLVNKYNDAVKPSISLCCIGLYSAGKSAFINSIIGAEVLPSDSDPTTAKVCKIICSEDYKIRFQFDGKECVLAFKNGDYKPNCNFDKDIIKELQNIVESERHDEVYHMNAALAIINNYKDEKHKISDIVEIEVPFVSTGLPVDKCDFVIYDTPGSNSKNNKNHFEVLRDSLDKQTNALPIFLTTPDTMDAEDNDKLFEIIEEAGTALDTTNTIIVVNKADDKCPDDLKKKSDNIGNSSITKWKSTRIFFLSSVIGIASKKDNPDDPEQWLDEDMYEIYSDKKSKYVNDQRKLFEYNIIDKSRLDESEDYKDNAMTTHLYKNCGLESVEKEIAEYARRYALYNKYYQASLYLQEAIDMCVKNIQETEQQLNTALNEAKRQLDTKEKELCDKLEAKKKDIIKYNTELQELLQAKFELYTILHHIVEGNITAQKPLRDELQKIWKKYQEGEKGNKLRKKNGWALAQMQNHVEYRYNDLLKQFSESANSTLVIFWDRKSFLFKRECIAIVHGSNTLTDKQKERLESIVLFKSNMDTYRMEFNLRRIEAIRKKRFLFWKLKSEKFDVGTCVSSIVSMFYDSVGKMINSTMVRNEKNFKMWTDELISELTEELCKFNSDLNTIEKKIAKLNSEINTKKRYIVMLEENKRYIEGLLDIQEGR